MTEIEIINIVVNDVLKRIKAEIIDKSYLSYDDNPRRIIDESWVLEIIDRYKTVCTKQEVRIDEMPAILTIEKTPKTCDECPLFVNGHLGIPAFCVMDAEYTDEEIDKEEDGNLDMYYHGCLSKRPQSCPLKVKGEKV